MTEKKTKSSKKKSRNKREETSRIKRINSGRKVKDKQRESYKFEGITVIIKKRYRYKEKDRKERSIMKSKIEKIRKK